MKKTIRAMISVILVLSLFVALSATAFATNETAFSDEAVVAENIISESVELEIGTLYLEETIVYRIAYMVYLDGRVSYSICYKDMPGVAHTGTYYPSDNIESESTLASGDIISELLSLEAEEIINFNARPQPRTITTTSAAITFLKSAGIGYKDPGSTFLGTIVRQGVTCFVDEAVSSNATLDNIINYYINDTLVSLVSLVFGLNLTKILRIITNGVNLAGDLVAQRNGTLTYFTIENNRMKLASIGGTTWYWAAWDITYEVYSGDKSTYADTRYSFKHGDYDYSVVWFGEKAINNYLGIW